MKASDYLEKSDLSGLKNKAVKSGGINVISTLISVLIQTISVVVLGRLLKPSDFGVVSMVTAVFMLLMNFGANGFTEYIIQNETINDNELNGIFWIHAAMSLALTLMFIAAGPLLSRFYNEPVIRSITTVMAAGIMAQMLSTLPQSLLKRRMEYGKLAVNNVLTSFLSSALAIAMAYMGMSYWAVVMRQLSVVVFTTIGSWIICRWRPSLPQRSKGFWSIVRYALRVYGNFMLGYFSRSLDKILLGRFFGAQILGNYDRSYYISSIPVEQLVSPLHNIGLATLSRLHDDANRYYAYYKKALTTLAFLGFYVSIVVTVSGRDLVQIILGQGWEQAGWIVTAFGPGIGVNILYSTYSWIHLSIARPDRWLRWSLLSFLLTAAFLFAVSPTGPVAVAAAYSIFFYLMLAPSIWYAGRPIKLNTMGLMKAILPYLISGVITSALLWVGADRWLKTAFSPDTFGALIRFLIVCITGGLVYSGILVALTRRLDSIQDFISFLKLLLTRSR